MLTLACRCCAPLPLTALLASAALGTDATDRPYRRGRVDRAVDDPQLADLLAAASDGIDPTQVWDVHAHLVGTGVSGSGAYVHPATTTWRAPVERLRRKMILDAARIDEEPAASLDQRYCARLLERVNAMPTGYRTLLFAFDYAHNEQGRACPERSTFHVPDAYARGVAASAPTRFEWVASIHPYRDDAVAALLQAAAGGARAIKWLPSSMAIDPASPRCDAFYAGLHELDLPLIVHCGAERSAPGARQEQLNNPLRIRRALEHGVRVVIAHAASSGVAEDLDRAGVPTVPAFDLFARLMDTPRYERHLFADISAVLQRNRPIAVLRTLLARDAWHPRLLNGTDYPVPGIALAYSMRRLADAALIPRQAATALRRLQRANPIVFDWLLKRTVSHAGHRFAANCFQTRDFFDGSRRPQHPPGRTPQ